MTRARNVVPRLRRRKRLMRRAKGFGVVVTVFFVQLKRLSCDQVTLHIEIAVTKKELFVVFGFNVLMLRLDLTV